MYNFKLIRIVTIEDQQSRLKKRTIEWAPKFLAALLYVAARNRLRIVAASTAASAINNQQIDYKLSLAS